MDEKWTEYERDAVLRVLQKALESNSVPPEDRAAVVRGKRRLEATEIKKHAVPPRGRVSRRPPWED